MEFGGWEKVPEALSMWTLASSDSPETASIIVPCRVPIETSSHFAIPNSYVTLRGTSTGSVPVDGAQYLAAELVEVAAAEVHKTA